MVVESGWWVWFSDLGWRVWWDFGVDVWCLEFFLFLDSFWWIWCDLVLGLWLECCMLWCFLCLYWRGLWWLWGLVFFCCFCWFRVWCRVFCCLLMSICRSSCWWDGLSLYWGWFWVVRDGVVLLFVFSLFLWDLVFFVRLSWGFWCYCVGSDCWFWVLGGCCWWIVWLLRRCFWCVLVWCCWLWGRGLWGVVFVCWIMSFRGLVWFWRRWGRYVLVLLGGLFLVWCWLVVCWCRDLWCWWFVVFVLFLLIGCCLLIFCSCCLSVRVWVFCFDIWFCCWFWWCCDVVGWLVLMDWLCWSVFWFYVCERCCLVWWDWRVWGFFWLLLLFGSDWVGWGGRCSLVSGFCDVYSWLVRLCRCWLF